MTRTGLAAWSRFIFWFVVAGIGLAASLSLIEAGPHVRYQHYRPAEHWQSGLGKAALAAIGAQALVVTAGLFVRRHQAAAWLRSRANWPTWLCVLAVATLPAASLSRSLGEYLPELAFAVLVQAVNGGNAALLFGATPASVRGWLFHCFDGRTAASKTSENGGDPFVFGCAAFAVLVSVGLSWFAYDRHPHIADEVCYLVQAKYFSQGLIAAPSIAVEPAFELDGMTYEADRWYSCFPPGWPALLAPSVLVGAEWLLNPGLTGLNVLLAASLLKAWYDQRTARMGALLLSFSPWFLFMGMNFMAHQATLALALISARFMQRTVRNGAASWAGAAGLAAGLTTLMRPLDGLIVGCVVGPCALAAITWRRKILGLAAFGGGAILGAAPNLPYNQQLTGSPLQFPVMAYFDKYYTPGANAMGFGSNRGLGWTGLDPFHGHGAIDVAINTALNAFAVNVELFGWAGGSLLLIACHSFLGRMTRVDWSLLGAIGVVVGCHSLYWFSGGPDFGARYWYLAIVPGVGLTARALQMFAGLTDADSPDARMAYVRLCMGATSLCVLSALIFVPWRGYDKYRNYRGMQSGIRELAGQHGWTHDLVLIRGERFPDYSSAAVYNEITPKSGAPIYAWDRGQKTREMLLKSYGDRRVWVVNGPSFGGGGFHVVVGPIQASDLISAGLAE